MTPDYGTCPVCGKGYLLDARGDVRRHNRVTLPGHPEMGVLCDGSGKPSAGREVDRG